MNDKLTKSLENYLLAINEIKSKGNCNIKVKDVANYLGIGGPSTADAVRTLKDKGYIDYEPYKSIDLTQKGLNKINAKKYRQNTIKRFLTDVLEIESSLAQTNSQNIEFFMSEIVLERFVNFLDFMEKCSCKEPKWIKSCKNTLNNGQMSDKCKECIGHKEQICCCGGCND